MIRASSPTQGYFEPIERASRDEISALQLERMRWSIGHAYERVPHYRKACNAVGAHPTDLNALSDLEKFPFTTKQDLRDNYPFGMFAVPREQIIRIHASSGTTGKPTIVGYTKQDIDTWATLVARSIVAAGGRAGDLVHVAYGYGLFTGGLGAHYGAEKLGCTVIPASGGRTEQQVQLIHDLCPTIIMVTPSYMLRLIEAFQSQGLDARASSLRVGIFGAEPWTNAMRETIETHAGMDAVDIYGLSEVMGPGVASECVESKDGPVIWEDHFYPEVVDPTTGVRLPEGELGELVLTSLTKEALPVIRYRTHDLTRLLPPTARSMRRMAKVVGRSDDMLIVRGVNVFPTQIEDLVLQCHDLAPYYVLHVSRPKDVDEVRLDVEVRSEVTDVGTARALASARLKRLVKSFVGITINVNAMAPGSIERSAGKAKHVVDSRRPLDS